MKTRILVWTITMLAVILAAANAEQEGQTGGKCVPPPEQWEKWDAFVGADCIIGTMLFSRVGLGDTVLIEIVSSQGTLASDEPVSVSQVTPEPASGTAVISQVRLSDKRVLVALDSCSTAAETVNLDVALESGDTLGVTLSLLWP